MAKVLPLLNRLIPSDLARKALEKKIPHLTKYFAGAAGAGYGLDSALDFLRDQFEPIPSDGLRADEQAALKRVQQGDILKGGVKGLGKAAIGAGVTAAGAAAIPSVIGNLFQGQGGQEQQVATSGNVIAQQSPELAAFIEEQLQKGQDVLAAGALAQLQKEKFGKIISKLERDLKMPFSEILNRSYGSQASQQQQAQGQPESPSGAGGQNGKAALMQTMQQISEVLRGMRGNG